MIEAEQAGFTVDPNYTVDVFDPFQNNRRGFQDIKYLKSTDAMSICYVPNIIRHQQGIWPGSFLSIQPIREEEAWRAQAEAIGPKIIAVFFSSDADVTGSYFEGDLYSLHGVRRPLRLRERRYVEILLRKDFL